MENIIKHDRTHTKSYAISASADKDTIYYPTDSTFIILNKKEYGNTEELRNELENNYVKQEGYYPNLIAGHAKSLDDFSEIIEERIGSIESELPNKADISDLPNVIAEEVVDEDTFEDINKVTREDLKKDLFIDLWNDACCGGLSSIGSYYPVNAKFGRYNEETGYFELNGYTDIDYDEAREILRLSNILNSGYHTNSISASLQRRHVRTIIPIRKGNADFSGVSICGCEKILFSVDFGDRFGDYAVTGLNNSITNRELKYVATEFSALNFVYLTSWNGFYNANNLIEFRIKNTKIGFTIEKSPYVSFTSLKYLVDNASNTSNITFKLHKNVYSAFTGEATYPFNGGTQEEWQQLLQDAAEKQITFATV